MGYRTRLATAPEDPHRLQRFFRRGRGLP
jgi:hypothetical protein